MTSRTDEPRGLPSPAARRKSCCRGHPNNPGSHPDNPGPTNPRDHAHEACAANHLQDHPQDHRRCRSSHPLGRCANPSPQPPEHPFYFLLIAAGPPGSGLDTVRLTVGDGAETAESAPSVTGLGFSYAAAGPIVTGDVQLIDVDIDPVQ